jgi:MerR family transcriptional regulator, light-induced transcriptional regulator
MTEEAGFYPISTLSARTGVNTVTLRAWERRYGLLKPKRTPKGHRLYSDQDVALIKSVLRLLEEGVSISQVRPLLEQPGAEGTVASDTWTRTRQALIRAIEGFDETRLEQLYSEALSLYPVDMVTRRLLLPLLRELGTRWESAVGSVAEEHFFALYLRNKLGARFHHRTPNPAGPKLLAACLPGEMHELGLLLFALAAHEAGYRVVLLGANMPLTELPVVVKRTGAEALVLSGSIEPVAGLLEQDLPALVRALRIPVFIGGSTAAAHGAAIDAAGAIAAGESLMQGIERIAAVLPPRLQPSA